jgi:Tfp pilus assembly protein PilN
MPLTVNLFYPKQKADLEKKLDPVKIGILIAIVVIGSLFLWYSVQNTRLEKLRDVKNDLERQWEQKQPDHQTALESKEEDDEIIASAEALLDAIEQRFYWAPLLSLFHNVTPPEVQITSLNGNFSKESGAISLSVSGIAAGEVPSYTADTYRTTLRDKLEAEYVDAVVEFTQLGESTGQVQLNGETLGTARFTMSVQVETMEAEEETQGPTDEEN